MKRFHINKKIHVGLCIGLTAISSTVFSQTVLESKLNRPRSGDNLWKQEVRFKDPGRSGKNVLWDFSALEPVVHQENKQIGSFDGVDWTKPVDISMYVKVVDETHRKVTFFDSDPGIVSALDNGAIYRYNDRGDSILIWEYETPSTRISYDRPQTWMKFPFAYGDSFSSHYNGEGTLYEQTGMISSGILAVEADAYGMMILPDKDTLENVLRVRILQTHIDERMPVGVLKEKMEIQENSLAGKTTEKEADPVKAFELTLAKATASEDKKPLYTETIRWYATGYRYPVFETIRSFTGESEKASLENSRAFFYHPEEQQNDYLEQDRENLALLETAKAEKMKRLKAGETGAISTGGIEQAIRYNVYPNPSPGDIEVEIALPEETTVEVALYSISGSLLYRSGSATYSGIYHKNVPLQKQPRGNYILQIRCGEKSYSEKITRK